jgi:hypothetical protein
MSATVINMLLKLTALLLAALLWFNAITQKQYEYDFSLPITAVDVPSGLALANELPKSLTVKVRADGRHLLRSDWKKAGLKIKASRLKRGVNTIELNLESVSLVRPDNITLLELAGGATIPIVLDRIDSAVVPIASRLTIIPAGGFVEVKSKNSLIPALMKVKGPASLLPGIDSIRTERRTLTRLKASTRLPLELIRPEGKAVSLSGDSVVAAITIEKAKTKRLDNIPIFTGGTSDRRLTLIPQQIILDLEGPESLMDTLTAADIIARVDVGDANGYAVPNIKLPANVTVTRITPDSIRVLVGQ